MSKKDFTHGIGDLVLVKWEDGMVYFAKIKRIDWRRRQCLVIFDDKSSDKANFSQIHSVDETTTDIICIKCKKDNSEFPNEIVLCDGCGIGFHQKCHSPTIPATALELNNPWKCIYCQRSTKNPYLTESIDAMQSLFEEESDPEKNSNQQNNKMANDIFIKQEVVSEDESSSSTQMVYQKPTVQSVQRKRKARASVNEGKKVQSKKRPLNVLRRKFARSRLGRSAASLSSHKRLMDSQKQSLIVSGKDDVQDMSTETESLLSPLPNQVSPLLRKRKASDVGYHNCEASEDDSETSSSDSDDALDSNDETSSPERPQKRPRSLRVSLTLPPSVETTPIHSRAPVGTAFNPPTTIKEHAIETPVLSQSSSLTTMEAEPTPVEAEPTPMEAEAHVSTPKSPDKPEPLPTMETTSDKPEPLPAIEATSAVVTPIIPDKPDIPPTTNHSDSSGDTVSQSSITTVTPPESNSQCAPVSTIASPKPTTSISSSLVKVSAGVTNLKPNKRKRPTAIALNTDLHSRGLATTTSATLSPLEQLRYEIAASKRPQKTKKMPPHHGTPSTVLLQSTGTITSAPPIQSAAVPHHHHSRKSSAPTRSVSSVGELSPEVKQNGTQTDPAQNPIVISPSPSPPPLPVIGTTRPQLLAQHAIRRPSTQSQVPKQDERIYSMTPISKSHGMIMSDQRSNAVLPSLKPHRSRGYVFHQSHLQTKPTQVQTEPLRHPKQHPYSKYHHQQMLPTQPLDHNGADQLLQEHQSHVIQAAHNTHYPGTYSSPISNGPATIPQPHQLVQNMAHRQSIPQNVTQYRNDVGSYQDDVRVITPKLVPVYAVVSPPPQQHVVHDPRSPVMSVPTQVSPHADSISVIRAPALTSDTTNQRMMSIDIDSARLGQQQVPAVSTGIYNQPAICTTKPYAVVNAIPTRPTMSHKTMSLPVASPPSSLKNPPPSNKSVNDDSCSSLQERQFQVGDSITVHKRIQELAMMREEATSDLTQRLQSFSDKYKDFDTLTANELMGIFHSALKKFQTSGKMYDSYNTKKPALEKIPPPNVQVCTLPSGQNQLQVQRRGYPDNAPVISSNQMSCSKPIPMLRNELTNSIHSRPSNRSHQVHTTGVFVPPSGSGAISSEGKQQRPLGDSHASLQVSSAPVAKSAMLFQAAFRENVTESAPSSFSSSSSQPGSVIVNSNRPTEKRRRKPEAPTNINQIRSMFAQNNPENNTVSQSTVSQNEGHNKPSDPKRICDSCGKHATFLCSGCHKIWYCGKDCQIKSWESHSRKCKP